ncbi:MAG: hypothetical protein K2K65_00810 [Duncaniella sp.]|nr:hypothetical protein [Duncaniella sp.]
MKKTIFTLALALVSMTGFSAIAQTQSTTETKVQTTKGSKSTDRKKTPRYNPFEGLNLTEQQKTELQALTPAKEKGNSQRNKVTKDKAQKKLSKKDKQTQRKQRMEQKIQNRRDYLAKVKTILSPDQYVKFLENSYAEQNMKKAHASKKFTRKKDSRKGKVRKDKR